MAQYMRRMSRTTGRSFDSYDELYRWSVRNIPEFWESIWRLADIKHSATYRTVLSGTEMWNSRWFDGARLNFADNLLRYRDDRTAVIGLVEGGERRCLTYAQLYDAVACCATGLRKLGVKEGDRVAAFIPNITEAIVAMLATTSLGAVWSSCSPDFGLKGVLDRFGQITPRVLLAADGYHYNGRAFDSLERVGQIVEQVPSIRHVIVVPLLGKPDVIAVRRGLLWSDLTQTQTDEIDFAQLPFDHPVYVLYSSGTTGIPKCMVHGAGGTLLQHYKEHVLHTDLSRDDVITYYTTCGWMMWNWLVSVLQVGATICLYDGSPSHPDMAVLWRTIEREKITVFGTSPKFLASCEKAGLVPGDTAGLLSLRTILSTGSPLTQANFEWVYRSVKADLQLASISGGTDIISCFMLGNPILPVYSGEIQCRGLGMKVETYDSDGRPVEGEVGELVCTAPFPSRPVFFWDDPGHEKYRQAYFQDFPGVWRHGDYIKITETGGVMVYGRSDATLNPGGVRIGTADIYAPLESLSDIKDAIAVGQRWKNDVRIILFVVLAMGVELTDELAKRIRQTIRTQQTPRHVPAKIIAVSDIPYTRNGKKVELAVTRIIHGEEVSNRDALANPESLDLFRDVPELREP